MKRISTFLLILSGGLILSGINPHDYMTWFLEVAPAIAGLLILTVTFKRFRFTDFTYLLILIHCCILFIGGHYTYAEVPLFDYIRDVFHQGRNNFDKLGHFAQGFIPALIARELFIRQNLVKRGGWLSFLVLMTCIGISAIYELIEWAVAVISGESAGAFLGTQGYVWDTQSDMFFATIGAACALLIFSRFQDRCIQKMEATTNTKI